MKDFYVYLFMREDFASPYYVGKGSGERCYVSKNTGRNCAAPKDKDRIRKVAENLTDAEACELEKKLILFYGKKCEGGVLRNVADGGNGGATRRGQKHTEETKRKISEGNKGKVISEETREKLRKSFTGRVASEEKRRKCSVAGKKAKGVPKPNGSHNRRECVVKGIKFSSLKEAGEHFGVTSSSVFRWLEDKPNPYEVTYEGKTYRSRTYLAEALGITKDTLRHRIRTNKIKLD